MELQSDDMQHFNRFLGALLLALPCLIMAQSTKHEFNSVIIQPSPNSIREIAVEFISRTVVMHV